MDGNTGHHLTGDTSRVIINTNGLEYIRAHVSERKKNRKTNPRGREVGTLLSPSVLFCRISLTHYLRGVAQFGRALALGASGRRFKSFHPDCIHTTTMHFYSVEYWQENWETLMERVENGETIGVENDNGERAVMVPADDELIRMYTDHEEGS